MIARIQHAGSEFEIDLKKGIDLSIPLFAKEESLRAWYVDAPKIEAVRVDGFVGEVKSGGSVNFRNIFFNPHGHGTHTECVGHISQEDYSVNQEIREFFFLAELITLDPEEREDDKVLTLKSLKAQLGSKRPEALIVRTTPNEASKLTKNYSNSNPAYFEEAFASYLNEIGIKHWLLDLPSVDREVDGGKLLAHRAFWGYPDTIRRDASITEMIYVPDEVKDGTYLLNLSFAPFENDASPSKPVIYPIINKGL